MSGQRSGSRNRVARVRGHGGARRVHACAGICLACLVLASSGTPFCCHPVCEYLAKTRNWDGSNNNIFFVKNEKGPRTRWDSLLALTRQNGAAKAPSIGTAPIQRRRIFSLKKHRIDGFPPPFLPEKIAERECRRAKTASRKCSSPGRGHFGAVFFCRWKNLQKKRKNEKLKKGSGHGGIRRSRLRSRSKRGETQKTEIPQRQTKRQSIF